MTRSEQLQQAERAVAMGRYNEAHALCMALLQSAPSDAAPYAVLGQIALANRVFDKAADLFRHAASLAPGNGFYWMRLAQADLGRNRKVEAAAAADRALAVMGADPQTWDDLGVIFSRLGRYEASLQCFERAVALSDRHSGYNLNLGWARQFTGDLAGAEQAYRAAIAFDPDAERAYVALIKMTEGPANSEWTQVLERLFPAASADPIRRLNVGHALAKIYEDQGDPEQSLYWLSQAKQGRRRDPVAVNAAAEALFAAAADQLAPGAEPAPPTGPVFVFGMPRSGTTLVDRILSSHPALTSVGEPMTLPVAVRQATGTTTGPLIDPGLLKGATPATLTRIADTYLRATAPRGAAVRFLDKTPLNFLYAGVIARAMPTARMICVRRDPVDSCLSVYRNLFDPAFDYYDFSYDLETAAHYVVLFNRFADACRRTLPSSLYTEVAYEDLIGAQRAESERLVAFCGLEWDERCLRFEANTAPVATASAAQVRRPIYTSSVGRWRRYGQAIEPALAILRSAGLVPQDKA